MCWQPVCTQTHWPACQACCCLKWSQARSMARAGLQRSQLLSLVRHRRRRRSSSSLTHCVQESTLGGGFADSTSLPTAQHPSCSLSCSGSSRCWSSICVVPSFLHLMVWSECTLDVVVLCGCCCVFCRPGWAATVCGCIQAVCLSLCTQCH